MLGALVGKKFGYKISFFNHSKTAHEVMKLGGGVGGMQLLVQDYKKYLKRFSYLPLSYPAILLVDNDTTSIFDAVKKAFGVSITLTSTAPFYHLAHNLYLIKTPELGSKGTSCIENFFDPSVLKTPVDGKTFNPAKVIDTAKEYGKIVLAEKGQAKCKLNRFQRICWDFRPHRRGDESLHKATQPNWWATFSKRGIITCTREAAIVDPVVPTPPLPSHTVPSASASSPARRVR